MASPRWQASASGLVVRKPASLCCQPELWNPKTASPSHSQTHSEADAVQGEPGGPGGLMGQAPLPGGNPSSRDSGQSGAEGDGGTGGPCPPGALGEARGGPHPHPFILPFQNLIEKQ